MPLTVYTALRKRTKKLKLNIKYQEEKETLIKRIKMIEQLISKF